jgi:sialate O-acetylesterase
MQIARALAVSTVWAGILFGQAAPEPFVEINFPGVNANRYVNLSVNDFERHRFAVDDHGVSREVGGVLLSKVLMTAGWSTIPKERESQYLVGVEGDGDEAHAFPFGEVMSRSLESRVWLITEEGGRPLAGADGPWLMVVEAGGVATEKIAHLRRIRVTNVATQQLGEDTDFGRLSAYEGEAGARVLWKEFVRVAGIPAVIVTWSTGERHGKTAVLLSERVGQRDGRGGEFTVVRLQSVGYAFAPTPPTAGRNSRPFVSPMFGDNMVLQRGKPNTIWGWSEPGEAVRVEIAGQAASTVTGPDGRWRVKLQPPPPGGPYSIGITGRQTVELHEVLVGDVWLCGGQSNMQVGLSRARNGAQEVAAANHPEIRFYTVQQHVSYTGAEAPQGAWTIVSPQTAGEGGGISAAAYFFARKLQETVHVPIGLVVDCVGGTPAEAWTSAEALHALGDFDVPLAEMQRQRTSGGPEYGNYIMSWYDQYDVGLKGGTWADPELDDSSWKAVEIPGGFAELGVADTPSLCWFRKEIVLPDPLPAGGARLFLGSIERMDTAFVNGHWVGASAWVENPRVYVIGAGVLKPGRNVLAVRVFKVKPQGGFLAKPEDLRLAVGELVVPLAGKWKGKVSVDARPPHPLPLSFENWPVMPTVLYEGMLAPVAPLAITGAIWYQGEANSDRAFQYRKLLPTMIADWRRLFGQGDFPFYIVSLPAFQHRRDAPGDDAWAEMREAQARTAESVANACLAVTIDTGDADNIHPQDKKEVGERLALCALAKHYGEKVVYAGPTFSSVERLPGALRLHFTHTDGGLIVKGGKLEEFSVAGEDHKWHWAEARVEGDTVVVRSKEVPDPKQARYAWQSNPAATLFNGAGLPAAPFRTDDWPGITEGHRPY